MATQIEKLQPEQLEKLKEFQAKSNDIVVSLGQISIRTRELQTEIKRLESVKEELDLDFDKNAEELNVVLKELEAKYPKGEVNLNDGTVIFDVEEK
jgi:DNA repair exonuclease SbcCD ATPase subunit